MNRMIEKLSTSPEELPHARRVLQALRANRRPGWQFPGHYLGISFEDLSAVGGQVSMPVARHCRDLQGRVALAAIAVLADVAFAAALRESAGADCRMATVSTRLSFAHAAGADRLVACAKRKMDLESLALPLAVSALTIHAGDAICCTGEAILAVLGNRRGTAPHPLPCDNRVEDLAPLEPDELTGPKQDVLARARSAESAAGPYSFLERFWEMVPQLGDGWAECTLSRGLHVGNRVGDVHGGVLLGLAAHVSTAALPEDWRLVDISAQFVAASSGQRVCARAQTIRVGRNIASVACRITDDAGHITLTAQATLARMG